MQRRMRMMGQMQRRRTMALKWDRRSRPDFVLTSRAGSEKLSFVCVCVCVSFVNCSSAVDGMYHVYQSPACGLLLYVCMYMCVYE